MKNNNNIEIKNDTATEAAEWFITLRDGDITEESYLKWQQWLGRSDANKQAFAKAECYWKQLDNITNPPWNDTGHDANNISSGEDNLARAGRRSRFMVFAAAIAATILIALSVELFYHNDFSARAETTTYQTARAGHKIIKLADGSKINLGALSIVNVNYTRAVRHLTLVRGEAIFSVAKNKKRPFVVRVGTGSVTAVGTRFNIHSGDRNVTVTVLEGVVVVNPDLADNKTRTAPLPKVSAGRAVSYDNKGDISPVVKTNVAAAISWEKGMLVRVDTPLASVIADVNRYSAREIIIGDPALDNIRFTGTVLNDGIDNWLRGLSVAYPIKVLDSGHDAILLLKKKK